MNEALKAAVHALRAADEKLQTGQLSSVAHRDAREPALMDALRAMAADHQVTLQEPLQVDALGEISIVAVHPDGPMLTRGCGKFGAAFAQALSEHKARTGVVPCGPLSPDNGWCRINHFEAEKMVLAYFEQLTNQAA